MTPKRRYLLSAFLLCGLAVMFAPFAMAQAPPAKENDGQKQDKESDKILREQTIYIPYEKLRKVFEKQGRGVFLPYEKFQELWKAAREKEKPPTSDQPPVGALLTEVENEATVAKNVVRVKAKVKIEVLAEGWNEIPLRLADAAITRAEIGGAAGADRPRRRQRLQAAVREEGQGTGVDRTRSGVRQGDHEHAGPEPGFVRGAASPGEPLAGRDPRVGRQGEHPSDDRRLRSARRKSRGRQERR